MMRYLLLGLGLLALAALAMVLWHDASPVLPSPDPAPAAAAPAAPAPASADPALPSGPARSEPAAATRSAVPSTPANADAAQGVHGRVLDARGAPIAGADAFLLESASNDPIHRFASLQHGVPTVPTASAHTGADGAFRLGLAAVDDRRYEVLLQANGCAAERLGELRLHAGEWLDLGDVRLLPGATIRGRVTVDGTDLPVPGAVVRLDSGNPFLDLGPAQLPGANDRRTATVDAQGEYELRDAPRSGAFRLQASAPGFGRHLRDNVQLADGQALRIDFALPRGRSIGGALDAGGRALGKVHIEAFSKSAEPVFLGTVGDDGRFFVHGLRDGPHLLKIAATGFQPVAIDNVAAGTENLTVVLVPRGSARVTVHNPDGALLRHYRLAVRRFYAETGQIGSVADVAERVVALPADATAAQIEGLGDGVYVFQVEASGCASTLSPPFAIDRNQPEADIAMTMTRGASLTGNVVDGAGRAVVGATVRTESDGERDDNPVLRMLAGLATDRITRQAATTDAAGRFALARLAHGPYQLTVEHPDYCRTQRLGIAIDADTAIAVPTIVLQRGTAVVGRALLDGVPTAQVLVVLSAAAAEGPEPGPGQKSRDETSARRVEAVTNLDGSFELPRRVPPGVYELRGALQLGPERAVDPFQKILQMSKSVQTVTIPPGQEVVVLELRL